MSPLIRWTLAVALLWSCAPSSVGSIATPDEIQLLAEARSQVNYRAVARYSERRGGVALRILQEGQVIFESYQDGYTPDTPHPLASGTKSFTCAYAALAEAEGILTLNDLAADTLFEWRSDPRKSQITIQDLLSLSSGLEDNPAFSPFRIARLDADQLALEATPQFDPGQEFIYGFTNFQAFALLVKRQTNLDPIDYLEQRLFQPLGFTSLSWQRDAQGQPQMAGGAQLSARDWGKYGQLFLDNGVWQGQQLLDPALIQRCHTYTNPAFLGYGLTWWVNVPYGDSYTPGVDQVPPDGLGTDGQLAPSAPDDLYVAAGLGRQRLYVIPSQDLVIVRLASLSLRSGSWSDERFLRLALGLDQWAF